MLSRAPKIWTWINKTLKLKFSTNPTLVSLGNYHRRGKEFWFVDHRYQSCLYRLRQSPLHFHISESHSQVRLFYAKTLKLRMSKFRIRANHKFISIIMDSLCLEYLILSSEHWNSILHGLTLQLKHVLISRNHRKVNEHHGLRFGWCVRCE